MEHWHSKPIGDGMWADIPSEEIKCLFQPLFESAGRPAVMAVFTWHEEGGRVEATGHFNVRSYLGLDGAPGSGYDGISYTVRISAPGATPEQIASLRERCERSSPVGDSMSRAIPLKLEFAANQ